MSKYNENIGKVIEMTKAGKPILYLMDNEGKKRSLKGIKYKKGIEKLRKEDVASYIIENKKIHIKRILHRGDDGEILRGLAIIDENHGIFKTDKNIELFGRIIGEDIEYDNCMAECTVEIGYNEDNNNRIFKIKEIFDIYPYEHRDLRRLHYMDVDTQPETFPTEVFKELKNISTDISEEEISKRTDYRNIRTFTIDPKTAKDFDDALSIEKSKNGGFIIGVHIADVSHYVIPGSKLDKEALNRGNSKYLPWTVIPMLPEYLSNGICSLSPNEDKLCVSFIMEFDKNYNLKSHDIIRTVISSDRRYTYEEAQDIIEGNLIDENAEYIKILDNIAKYLREERYKDGSLLIGSSEMKIEMDGDKPKSVYKFEQKDSNKLIEEFMLLSNKLMAKKLKSKGLSINRSHPEPKPEDMETFISNVREVLGYSLDRNKKPKDILVEAIKMATEEDKGYIIDIFLKKCLPKAIFTTEDIAHFGLGFDDYVMSTSPIRRYSDIVAHRLLFDKTGYDKKKVEIIARDITQKEIASIKLERTVMKEMASETINYSERFEPLKAIVTSVQYFGVFMELENGISGLLRSYDIKQISDNRFSIKDEVYKIGDFIDVYIDNIQVNGNIDFRIFNS